MRRRTALITALWSPSPTATAVALPQVAAVEGAVADWQLAPRTAVAEVGPEVGDAADGKIALVVDAPTVDGTIRVAQITAPVVDGTTYDISAQVRLLAEKPTAVDAALEVGATAIALPTLDASWTEITGTVTVSGASELSIVLRVDAPVTGLAIDDIVVAEKKGANVVPNASFENVTFAHRVVNTSLLMRTETALLSVVLTPGEATWTITRGDGTSGSDPVVSDGSVTSDGSVATIPVHRTRRLRHERASHRRQRPARVRAHRQCRRRPIRPARLARLLPADRDVAVASARGRSPRHHRADPLAMDLAAVVARTAARTEVRLPRRRAR